MYVFHPKVASLIPVEEIESAAIDQLKAVLALDFVSKVAVMPDIHAGFDLPVGCAALAKNVVVPAWVGFDIGCGMTYLDLGRAPIEIEALRDKPYIEETLERLHESIPVGFSRNERPAQMPKCLGDKFVSAIGSKDLDKEVTGLMGAQLGTLGSGNHFIEIGVNWEGNSCVTIHSGSRKAGHAIATYYVENCEKYLDACSSEAKAYLKDMEWAESWAYENRLLMLARVLKVLGLGDGSTADVFRAMRKPESHINPDSYINETHNHAIAVPYGDGKFWVLHRKGATQAMEGQYGVIPGNMRDGVYVTRGLGNMDFLSSASHGAGRVLSRKKAKATLDPVVFALQMQDSGIVCGNAPLDEAPGAYKDINRVIEAQDGVVVDVLGHVRPILNMKG